MKRSLRSTLDNAQADRVSFFGSWFRTGDQGYLDEEGYLFLTGRLKEIINRGGEKISPLLLDEALTRHSSVREACCFGLPDDKYGEIVAAAVVASQPVTELELKNFLADQPHDMAEAARGATVDGVGTMFAGLIGAMGLNPSPGAVALSQTTGSYHPRLGYYIGGLMGALAFFPRLVGAFIALPTAVVGSLLFFLGTALMLHGLKDLFQPGWGEYEQWTLGFPMAVGLSRVFFPAPFEAAPAGLRPFLDSPMTLTVMVLPPVLLLAYFAGLRESGR